jgi:hypothetical protein
MWKCKKCKEQVEDQFDACWNCGTNRNSAVNINEESENEKLEYKKEKEESKVSNKENKELFSSTSDFKNTGIKALRVLAWIFFVVAFINIIVYVLALINLFNSDPTTSLLIALGGIGGGFSFFQAFSVFIVSLSFWALFLSISSITESLLIIRKK